MKDRQNAVLDAVHRAQQFLEDNAALFNGVGDHAGARHGGGRTTLVIPGLAVDARIHSRVLAQPLAARRRDHGWRAAEAGDRIVGHDAQAVWTPEYTRAAGIRESRARLLWGAIGRKVDPTGVRADGRKIIDVRAVQAEVALRLGGRWGTGDGEQGTDSAEVVHAAA